MTKNHLILDYELHGIVRVRLINPRQHVANKLAIQLGSAQPPNGEQPDIIVRFQEELSVPQLTYLGLNSVAYSEEGFYVLDKNNGDIQARIPFEDIGNQCEILCKRGLDSVPLLFEIIRLVLLRKGFVPLHASAFLHNDAGILVMGWAKGGKTEMLLAFANHGAQYVGDEWVMLSADGQEMFGIPVSVAIREWHFDQIPNLLPQIGFQRRVLFEGIHLLDAVQSKLSNSRWKKSLLQKSLSQALPRFRQQLMIKKMPQQIFKDKCWTKMAAVDKVFLIMSHSRSDIEVAPIDAGELASRMLHSNSYEQGQFFEYYQAFKFAFPHLANEFLEQIEDRQKALLSEALKDNRTYAISHPYPVSFEELFVATEPYCKKEMESERGFGRNGNQPNAHEMLEPYASQEPA